MEDTATCLYWARHDTGDLRFATRRQAFEAPPGWYARAARPERSRVAPRAKPEPSLRRSAMLQTLAARRRPHRHRVLPRDVQAGGPAPATRRARRLPRSIASAGVHSARGEGGATRCRCAAARSRVRRWRASTAGGHKNAAGSPPTHAADLRDRRWGGRRAMRPWDAARSRSRPRSRCCRSRARASRPCRTASSSSTRSRG